MKHPYRWAPLLLAALLLLSLSLAQAQQAWRPFRPGLIYSYALRNSTTDMHTLRVDSAYRTTAGDSVYAFNRLMRRYSGSSSLGLNTYVKSRNNLFGARMRWVPGQPFYWLECDAQTNVQAAASLRINPRAAVGQTWVASTSPLLTAIVQARSYLPLPNSTVQDSVVTIEIRTGTATTGPPLIGFSISQNYGLLEATPWLGAAINATTSAPLVAALPAPLAQTPYSPRRIFDVQVGDEFGYQRYDIGMTPIQCDDTKQLRRVISKRITADSLIITYQEQTRYESFGYPPPYCYSPAQVSYSPIVIKRWELALAGNQWQPAAGTMAQFAALRLLTGEYIPGFTLYLGPPSFLLVGLPITLDGSACSGVSGGAHIAYAPYYPFLPSGSSTPLYKTGVDLAAWQYRFDEGMTTTMEGASFMGQIYSRKSINGTVKICGSPLAFVNLLPTRAAQAAAIATLAPNPATESATLTLAQPARAGSVLRLLDALGRSVWSAPITAGQTAVAVPLAGQPAGMYLLHLDSPAAPAASWKLLRQ